MSRRSRLAFIALVMLVLVLREAFGVEYPAWLRWATSLLVLLAGLALLVRPGLLSNMRPLMARLIGAIMSAAALFSILQFAQE